MDILTWITENPGTISLIAAALAVVFGKTIGPKVAAVLRIVANALDGGKPAPVPVPTPGPDVVPVPTPGPDVVPSDRPVLDLILQFLPVILPLLLKSKNSKVAKVREAVAELDVASLNSLADEAKVA